MQIHEIEHIVKEDDLDTLNHVNNVRYVQWVQDAAEAHWNLRSSESIRKNFYWVMISHHIQYKAEAFLGDLLLIKTYVTESKGVRSTRMVDIYNAKTDQLLTTSTTIWCFMSMEHNKPARIPNDINQLFD